MSSEILSQIIWRYAALEREVQNQIRSRCSAACSACSSCCCRADLCEESFQSSFLMILHGQKPDSPYFSDRYGWRTENGCSLGLGRPPVCYEYFCDEVLRCQPDDGTRFVLKLLGKLLDYVGSHALGSRHLVEITDEEDLNRIHLDAFKAKVGTARSVLEHVRFFFEHGFFDEDAAEQFKPVLPLPDELSVRP